MTLLVAGVFVFWAAIFLVVFHAQGRSFADFFWGDLPPPPVNLGSWEEIPPKIDCEEHANLVWEQRYLLDRGRLIQQVRAREGLNGPIVHVSPEIRVARSRRRRPET